jgi:hypothetical protein
VKRLAAFALAVFVAGTASLFGAAAPAAAAPAPARAPGDLCTTEEWRNPANFQTCVDRLADVASERAQCLQAPTPSAPDSGMAGWFASRPPSSRMPGPQGLYSDYGYAGYSYTTYDIGCVPTLMHPDYKFENTMANGEFLLSTSIVGAANALRERAWDPKFMWGWADPLVEKATKAVYAKVFTVFGAITLAVVGLYLLWRSRQSDMSAAMTTAGWAILVMVGVTAVASWPTWAANLADRTLITTLGVVHEAVGPPPQNTDPGKCVLPNPEACKDHRLPSVRASDTATEGMLYRNWLRGALGSADTTTAAKYGPVLYDAKSFTWDEIEEMRKDPKQRQPIIDAKAKRWMKVAEQIKTEDPEAYEYLQGTKGMERIGAGFIAVLSALFFAMFDITASILVLLGFLIFRWAVIAAPILGTIGLLRPASSGLRRLVNAVVAAIFNIVIFGTGAAIYLYAVTLIIGTASLPGWLQVVLIWLTGVVGWLLLRPYRRVTQLGGKDPSKAVTSVGNWHRLFFRDLRPAQIVEAGGALEPSGLRGRGLSSRQQDVRPEGRGEDRGTSTALNQPEEQTAEERGARQGRQPSRVPVWTEPDVAETPPSYAIYRPEKADQPAVQRSESTPARR